MDEGRNYINFMSPKHGSAVPLFPGGGEGGTQALIYFTSRGEC